MTELIFKYYIWWFIQVVSANIIIDQFSEVCINPMGSGQEKTSTQKVNHKQRKINQLRLDGIYGHYWISFVAAEKTFDVKYDAFM